MRIISRFIIFMSLITSQTQAAVGPPAPPALVSVSVNPSTAVGGASVTGTVTLLSSVPAAGPAVGIGLSSNNAAVASVPGSVNVAPGAATATFTITTHAIEDTANGSVIISASQTKLGGNPQHPSLTEITVKATVTVLPPAVRFLGLSLTPPRPPMMPLGRLPNKLTTTGGTPVYGLVELTGPAPVGIAIALNNAKDPLVTKVLLGSSDPSRATVPATISVTGGSTTQSFLITTSSATATAEVTISAHRIASDKKSAILTLTPPVLQSFTLTPSTVIGGATSTGTVTLTGPAPAGGAAVAISLNGGGVVTPINEIDIPAGSNTASVSFTTHPVASSTSVTITAAYGGVSKSATLTILAEALASLVCNPTSVVGGSPSTCKATLTGPAASGGLVVTLSSSSPTLASVPANVTVPAGQTTTNFTMTTKPVTNLTSVTVSASSGGVTKTATVTLSPAALSQLLVGGLGSYSLGSPPPDPGLIVAGFVALDGPAPSGGADVVLNFVGPVNSNSAVVLMYPQSVHIQDGATNAIFQITLYKCTSYTTGTYCDGNLNGTYKGVTKKAYVQVAN
jgi:trimeric autotransporter adhesin